VNKRVDFPMERSDAGADALRRCALALHGVSEEDRRWLLAKLPADRISELDLLLVELKSLGIAADPATARAALRSTAASAHTVRRPSRTTRSDPKRDALEDTPPGELARVLQHEPPSLIVHVLGMLGRETEEAVLAQINAPKRRQVQELLQTARPVAGHRSRLSEALRDELRTRLAPPPGAPLPGPGSAVAKWQAGWARVAGVFL
jgi:hypothetical protein